MFKKFYFMVMCAIVMCACSQKDVAESNPSNPIKGHSVENGMTPRQEIEYYGNLHNAFLDYVRQKESREVPMGATELYELYSEWAKQNLSESDYNSIADLNPLVLSCMESGCSDSYLSQISTEYIEKSPICTNVLQDATSGYKEILDNYYGKTTDAELVERYGQLAQNLYYKYYDECKDDNERHSVLAVLGVFYGSASYWLQYTSESHQDVTFYGGKPVDIKKPLSKGDFLLNALNADATGASLGIYFATAPGALAGGMALSAAYMLWHDVE